MVKICLVGYMGAGKSAIGKNISTSLKIKYIDLDKYIENQEDLSISTIFKKYGEIYFRKKESHYLKYILENENNFVLSTGGGTPIFYNHMALINEKTTSFYLYASPAVLAERLLSEKKHRPLVAHIKDENLTEFIAKHLFERNPFYQQATHTINTMQKSVEEIIEEIINLQNLT